jgi:hypothetical protein
MVIVDLGALAPRLDFTLLSYGFMKGWSGLKSVD